VSLRFFFSLFDNLGMTTTPYPSNGIQEYMVWQVFEHQLTWFSWYKSGYEPLPVDENGVIRSRVFPGLWLAVEDLLADIASDGCIRTDKSALALSLARHFARST
jgi:Putative restriction endonuclease